jgi:hypothetical protein
MNSCWIPDTWLLAPAFKLWSPRRHQAVLWILGHMIGYVVNNHGETTLQDYMDYMRRARWKATRDSRMTDKVGHYLEGLD